MLMIYVTVKCGLNYLCRRTAIQLGKYDSIKTEAVKLRDAMAHQEKIPLSVVDYQVEIHQGGQYYTILI